MNIRYVRRALLSRTIAIPPTANNLVIPVSGVSPTTAPIPGTSSWSADTFRSTPNSTTDTPYRDEW